MSWDVKISIKLISTSLSKEDKLVLDAPFSMQEIKDAVFSMAPLKAPRSDRFPIGFFQKYWNIIKHSASKFILDIL